MKNTKEYISLMTTKEVTNYLHCDAHYVTKLRRAGCIKACYIGSHYLYYADSIYAYVRHMEDCSTKGLSLKGLSNA